MRRALTALTTLLAVQLLAGCSGAGGDDLPTGATPSETAASQTDASETTDSDASGGAVPATLDFTGTTVSGESFEGASLADRPTLLWFWAPWCPTCRGQIPQVEGVAADHAGELNVIGIGSLDSAEAIAGFADDVDGVTHLEDVDGELWRRFGVTEQSSFVLLDAEGAVVFEAGYGGTDELDARVDDVVG
ncbi:MAG TPA: redoxin domain-containing protein [Nocardioides sp.]|nr:redoxin domain-containing protein [Nocardioides sp.]